MLGDWKGKRPDFATHSLKCTFLSQRPLLLKIQSLESKVQVLESTLQDMQQKHDSDIQQLINQITTLQAAPAASSHPEAVLLEETSTVYDEEYVILFCRCWLKLTHDLGDASHQYYPT